MTNMSTIPFYLPAVLYTIALMKGSNGLGQAKLLVAQLPMLSKSKCKVMNLSIFLIHSRFILGGQFFVLHYHPTYLKEF